MSFINNELLYDRAREVMEYFTNTMWERVIQRDLDSDDLEALAHHIKEAEAQMRHEEEAELRGF